MTVSFSKRPSRGLFGCEVYARDRPRWTMPLASLGRASAEQLRPPRAIIPRTGGLSVAAVPRPRLPFRRLRRPTRPSLGQSSVLDQNGAPGHAWSPVDHA